MDKKDRKLIEIIQSEHAPLLKVEEPGQYGHLLRRADRKYVDAVTEQLMDSGLTVYIGGGVVNSKLFNDAPTYGDVDMVATGSFENRGKMGDKLKGAAMITILGENEAIKRLDPEDFSKCYSFLADMKSRYGLNVAVMGDKRNNEPFQIYMNQFAENRFEISRKQGIIGSIPWLKSSKIDLCISPDIPKDIPEGYQRVFSMEEISKMSDWGFHLPSLSQKGSEEESLLEPRSSFLDLSEGILRHKFNDEGIFKEKTDLYKQIKEDLNLNNE